MTAAHYSNDDADVRIIDEDRKSDRHRENQDRKSLQSKSDDSDRSDPVRGWDPLGRLHRTAVRVWRKKTRGDFDDGDDDEWAAFIPRWWRDCRQVYAAGHPLQVAWQDLQAALTTGCVLLAQAIA